ncbi:unnamed protein product [Macrosiphum euphorbiae]|uniref:Uncharacterized protein n=1 Tax=Macrosiphum euphorbiae TaxID=13131 RepID=A0AAV0Y051_9HEMI|nr:unnamed protein product [Macrosiphum euphorbiae]
MKVRLETPPDRLRRHRHPAVPRKSLRHARDYNRQHTVDAAAHNKVVAARKRLTVALKIITNGTRDSGGTRETANRSGGTQN